MDFLACSLRNFNVSDYNGPIEIESNGKFLFYLIFQNRDIANIAFSYNYSINYGSEEVRRLQENYVCFGLIENSILEVPKRRAIVNNFYSYAQLFSTALWFIKDNAVTPYFATISSNSKINPEGLKRNIYYSDSKTSFDDTTFNTQEIKEAMKWYDLLDGFSHKVKRDEFDLSPGLTNMHNYIPFEMPSYQRAIGYLDSARRMDFLPSKIATYITILEMLFSVKGENTHKVAERTAALIGRSNDERLKLFKDITSAYDIRSNYVHGTEIKSSKRELLPNTSSHLDSIVRKVLVEMLTKYPELNYTSKKDKNKPHLKNVEEVNDWFNHLVLSRE